MGSSGDLSSGSGGGATRWRLELEGRPRNVEIAADPRLTQPCVARGGAPEPVVDATRSVVTVTFPRRIPRSDPGPAPGLVLATTFGWEITASRGVEGLRADLTGIALDGVEIRRAVVASRFDLPRPRGTVRIRLGAGAAELTIERPRGVPARVQVGAGTRGLTLDGSEFGAVGGSSDWQSTDYDRSADRYLISIAKGARNVSIRAVDRADPPPRRLLATGLFTDIVGSTEQASELGDRRWSQLLDLHDRLAEQHLEDAGGHVVKRTGDGMLARFEQPGDAIGATIELRAALVERGIHIRAGLHTGEIEIREDDVAGIAVHLASRIMAEAAPNEVLASRTVRDLVTGASFAFEDRGSHALKGIDGEWRLFAVGPA